MKNLEKKLKKINFTIGCIKDVERLFRNLGLRVNNVYCRVYLPQICLGVEIKEELSEDEKQKIRDHIEEFLVNCFCINVINIIGENDFRGVAK